MPPLVTGKVVHHDDVAGAQFRNQHLFVVSLKCDAVDRPGEDEGRDHAVQGKCTDERRRVPVPIRRPHAQTLIAPTSPMGAGHIGLHPCFVDQHEAGRIQVRLGVEPGPAFAQDIGSVLLSSMPSLFLRVMS